MNNPFIFKWKSTGNNVKITLPFMVDWDNEIYQEAIIDWGDNSPITFRSRLDSESGDELSHTYNQTNTTFTVKICSSEGYLGYYNDLLGNVSPSPLLTNSITGLVSGTIPEFDFNFAVINDSLQILVSTISQEILLKTIEGTRTLSSTEISGISGWYDYDLNNTITNVIDNTGTDVWINFGSGDYFITPNEKISLICGYDYKITSGKLEGWNFTLADDDRANDDDNKNQFIEIEDWGDLKLINAENAFSGCINLTHVPNTNTDTLFDNITSLRRMFYNCEKLNNDDLNEWNVSNIQDMSFLFYGCAAFNGNIEDWDVSNVITMQSMFQNANNYNPTQIWPNISNLENAELMFNGSGLNSTTYSNILTTWGIDNTNVPDGVIFSVGGVQYEDYEPVAIARDNLITNKNWTIYDWGKVYTDPDVFPDDLIQWQCNGHGDCVEHTGPNITPETPGVDPRAHDNWEGRWIIERLNDNGFVYPNLDEFEGVTHGPYISSPWQPREDALSALPPIDVSLNTPPSSIQADNLNIIYSRAENLRRNAVVQQFNWVPIWDDKNVESSMIINANEYNDLGNALNDLKEKFICTQYIDSTTCFSNQPWCGSNLLSHCPGDCEKNNITYARVWCSASYGRQCESISPQSHSNCEANTSRENVDHEAFNPTAGSRRSCRRTDFYLCNGQWPHFPERAYPGRGGSCPPWENVEREFPYTFGSAPG